MPEALYWHVFVHYAPELSGNVTAIFGDSTMPPAEAAVIGLGFDPPHYWVDSFDHDPEDDEVNGAILNRLVIALGDIREREADRDYLRKLKEAASGV